MTIDQIRNKLQKLSSKKKAKVLQGFFKTGPGEYGEGDIFLGITVPALRHLAKECRDTCLADAVQLLRSSIHEERLLALLLFMNFYANGDNSAKKKIYFLYLKNTRYINNWDLVDVSAPHIVGDYLVDKPRQPLYALAKSNHLWKRRIAIVSTLNFIRRYDFAETLRVARILVRDDHDLIQKAVGWMLREIGKRDRSAEEKFLARHYKIMPRTMLRYAIERFREPARKRYLKAVL